MTTPRMNRNSDLIVGFLQPWRAFLLNNRLRYCYFGWQRTFSRTSHRFLSGFAFINGFRRRKQDVFPFHRRPAPQEKLAKFGSVELLVFTGIQAEEYAAAGVEIASQVVEEKGPLGRTPPPVTFAVKFDRKSRDQVELAARIWQR